MYITLNSQFRPFTYDELVKPLQDYGEAYREVEEQYNTLAQQTEAWKNIATQENSPEAYAMYKKYSDELNAVVEDFSKGMTMQNRSKLMGLKSRYASEIGNIETAYKKYNEMNTARNALVAADNSIVFATNYSSMDDFLHGEVADNSFISGKQLEATTASRAQAAAYNKVNELIAFGMDSDLAASTVISSPTIKEEIINDSLSSIDLSLFDEEAQNKIRSYIALGADTGIGTFATNEYVTAAQREQLNMQQKQYDLEAARYKADLVSRGLTEEGKLDPYSPIHAASGIVFKKDEDGNFVYDDKGNPIIDTPTGMFIPGLNDWTKYRGASDKSSSKALSYLNNEGGTDDPDEAYVVTVPFLSDGYTDIREEIKSNTQLSSILLLPNSELNNYSLSVAFDKNGYMVGYRVFKSGGGYINDLNLDSSTDPRK